MICVCSQVFFYKHIYKVTGIFPAFKAAEIVPKLSCPNLMSQFSDLQGDLWESILLSPRYQVIMRSTFTQFVIAVAHVVEFTSEPGHFFAKLLYFITGIAVLKTAAWSLGGSVSRGLLMEPCAGPLCGGVTSSQGPHALGLIDWNQALD